MKGFIFIYVLTYGGAIVALYRPFAGFLIYVCFAIIVPEAMWGFSLGVGGNHFSRIVAVALLLGWALNGFGNWQLGRAKAILFCLIGFWVWSLASSLQAVASTEVALGEVESYAKILIAFVAGLTLIQSVQQVKWLAWVMVATTGYMAYEFNQFYWHTDYEFVAHEWTYASWDNNGIAIAMVASAGLAFFMGLSSTRWWQMLPCLIAAALMVHVVLFSMSRGGMLALLVTGFVSFLIIPKRPLYLLLFLIAILVALRLAGDMVWERFNTIFAEERDASAESRLDLWTTCVRVMFDYPLLGIGPHNWPLVATQYGFMRGKAAHTLWLNVGAEMGIPGLAFLVLFYTICLARLLRYVRESTPVVDPWFHGLARMVVASIIGFMVSAQFVSVQAVELPYYIVLLGAAMLKVQSLQTSPAAAFAWQTPAPLASAPQPPLGARPFPYPVRP